MKHASKEVLKESEVVIHKVEDGGRKVIVKTKDGAQQACQVSKDVTVTTGKKIADAGSDCRFENQRGS